MEMRIQIGWTLIVLMVTMQVGCQTLGTPVEERAHVIDQAMAEISQDRTKWANVLQGVPSRLPDSVDAVVREEAHRLASRSVVPATTTFHCPVDFLGARAIQSLERMKKMDSGAPSPAPLPPALCQVTPDVVDLGSDPSNWETVTFHGYDLDQEGEKDSPLKFFVINEDHSVIQPVPEAIIERVTHSQVSLHLMGLVETLHTKNIYQIVPSGKGKLEGTTTGEVIVKAWRPQKRQLTVELEKSTYVPPHLSGDLDFHTGPKDAMYGFVAANIESDGHTIKGHIEMNARQQNGDKTQAQGEQEVVLYEIPENLKILQMLPVKPSKKPFFLTKGGVHSFNQPPGYAVREFNVYGDHKGDDAGEFTRVEVDWQPITLEVLETRPPWMTKKGESMNDSPEVELTRHPVEDPKILINQSDR